MLSIILGFSYELFVMGEGIAIPNIKENLKLYNYD